MTFAPQEQASLHDLTTLGIAARAAWLARAGRVEDLADAQAFAHRHAVPWMVLGGGSNVLFAEDYPGLVVVNALRGVEDLGASSEERRLRVAAGESWPGLVEALAVAGIEGLENLAMIPGSAGAAPIQNIGAYGVELAERLESVRVWDPDLGDCTTIAAADCGFGYRESRFKHGEGARQVVVSLDLRLPRGAPPATGYTELARELAARGCTQPTARDVFDAVCAVRRRKLPDPRTIGNAGSFFKNPVVPRAQHAHLLEHFPSLVSYPLAGGRYKLAAGWLIEACGLKGAVRGRAGVYAEQALVLVNRGGATGGEILALAREVRDAVQARFGVELEPEVRIVAGGSASTSIDHPLQSRNP